MAWIQLEDDFSDHKKITKLSELLRIDKDMAAGKLVRLWLWALNSREDGFFQAHDTETIAEKMRFKGKPAQLVNALVECRLLDTVEGGYQIHDWEDRVYMLMQIREDRRESDRKRKQNERARKRMVSSPIYSDWKSAFGKAANPAQISELEMLAGNYDYDTMRELIRCAAVAGAEQPVLYIRGMCRFLDSLNIKTYEDYAAYADEIEAEKMRISGATIRAFGT